MTTDPATSQDIDEGLYHPIQVVAQRAGLTADVIRIWERRYGVVDPNRSSANQRLYSEEDIRRLRLLRVATNNGRRISTIAKLTNDELERLIAGDANIDHMPVVDRKPRAGNPQAQSVEAALQAIINLDPDKLEQELTRATVNFGLISFLSDVAAPLMRRVGELWRNGEVRTCQEHMTSAYLRSYLGQLIHNANISSGGPVLVVATPPNQEHEIGALMSAVIAGTCGWRILYLGASVPPEEIAYAAELRQAVAVALSISYPSDDPNLPGELRRLRRQLPQEVGIVVGGSAVEYLSEVLEDIGAKVVSTLHHFSITLDHIRLEQRHGQEQTIV